MTISLTFPSATLEKLEARAAVTGKGIDTLVLEAVEKDMAVTTMKKSTTRARSFRTIMAPVHKEFRKSGMTDGELTILIEQEVEAARSDRRAPTRHR